MAALYFPKRFVVPWTPPPRVVWFSHTRLSVSLPSVPYSDAGAPVRSLSDPGLHGTSLSPQTASSGGDSGVDSYCDHVADLPSITISLCGGLADNREITKGGGPPRRNTNVTKVARTEPEQLFVVRLITEQFTEKIISYQQFAENPSIIDDPNLVVRIGSK